MRDLGIWHILLILFSTQIIRTYMEAFCGRKKVPCPGRWLTWGAYALFQYWVTVFGASWPLFVLVVNIALIFLICRLSYQVTNQAALFHAGIFCTAWMLFEVFTYSMLHFAGAGGFLIGGAISRMAMYILLQVLKRFRKSDFFMEVPFHYWIRLFAVPVITIYIIHNAYGLYYSSPHEISENGGSFLHTITILMLLVNYIIFDVYDRLGAQQEAKRKNLVYEQQITQCNRQAAERENAYQETRRVRHDLKGYLMDLKATLQSGRADEAVSKIDRILAKNQIYQNEVSRSGNLVVDSLINYQHSLAQKEGIDIKCYVFVPEHLPFNGADLCIILRNLLDNAIEASGKLEADRRHVDVTVSQVKGSLCIVIRNAYEGRIRKNSSGQILTSKKDYRNHGIGLASVQRTVDKYNGEMIADYDGAIFKVTVLLYPPEKLHGEP
jgi:hypothetical protein